MLIELITTESVYTGSVLRYGGNKVTAYLAGGKGISFLRLSVITLTFMSSSNMKQYLEVKSFENGEITVLAESLTGDKTNIEVINLESIRQNLHLSRSLISNITNIELGT